MQLVSIPEQRERPIKVIKPPASADPARLLQRARPHPSHPHHRTAPHRALATTARRAPDAPGRRSRVAPRRAPTAPVRALARATRRGRGEETEQATKRAGDPRARRAAAVSIPSNTSSSLSPPVLQESRGLLVHTPILEKETTRGDTEIGRG